MDVVLNKKYSVIYLLPVCRYSIGKMPAGGNHGIQKRHFVFRHIFCSINNRFYQRDGLDAEIRFGNQEGQPGGYD